MPSLRLVLPLLVLIGFAPPTLAATADEAVAATTQAWAEAFNSRNPARVLALYDPAAVFWGTTSTTLRDTPEEIHEYFKTMPDRPLARVAIGEYRVRVFGDIAINTGSYTFTNIRADGTTETNPTRFSFTYRLHDGKWRIVDHHSSRVPPPPQP